MNGNIHPKEEKSEGAQLKDVCCNLCDTYSRSRICTRPDGIPVVRCPKCGLMYCQPRPTPQAMAQEYADRYLTKNGGIGMGSTYLVAQERQLEDPENYWRRLIQKITHSYGRRGRILDVGCSAGFFLKNAQDEGWEPYGIDLSPDAIAYAEKQLGLRNVSYSTLDAVGFEDEYFDAIMMHNVIEHFFDPQAELSRANDLLRKNGVLCVSTFNSKWAQLLRQRWHGFNAYFEHLYFFTPKTLQEMLSKTGFRVDGLDLMDLSFTTGVTRTIGKKIDQEAFPSYLLKLASRARESWRLLNRCVMRVPQQFGYSRIMTFFARKARWM